MKKHFPYLALLVVILFFSTNVSCQNKSNNIPLYSKTVIQIEPSIKEPSVIDLAIAYTSVFYPNQKNKLEEISKGKPNIDNSEEKTDVEWNKQLSVVEMRDSDFNLSFRVWERNNGHKLFAVNILLNEEDELNSDLLFYDYDPLSNKLTPDTVLYKWFKERFHINSLIIDDGKDVQGYYKNYNVRIRYNGYAFDEFNMKDILCSCFIEYFRVFDYPEKRLKIPAEITNPKIKDFAAVIAKSFSNFSDNDYTLCGYYEDGLDATTKAIKRIDKDGVWSNYKPNFNYFDVTVGGGEQDYTFRCWKRDNGHTLVAFHCGKETDCDTYILVFYDYNPNTHELLPDLEMTKRFEKRYGGFSGKEYNVLCNLLEKDGYIRVLKITEEHENDEEIYLKWNGHSFVR